MPKKLNKKNSARIKPIMVVVCDDIREEKNGKDIVLGIYKNNISITRPKNEAENVINVLRLSLWIPFDIKHEGEVSVEFEIANPEGERTAIKANLNVEKIPANWEITAFKFVGLPMALNKEGDIKVFFRHEGDKEWELIKEIPVQIKNSTNEIKQLF